MTNFQGMDNLVGVFDCISTEQNTHGTVVYYDPFGPYVGCNAMAIFDTGSISGFFACAFGYGESRFRAWSKTDHVYH